MPTLKIIFGLFEIREERPTVQLVHCHGTMLASGVDPLPPVCGLEEAQMLDLGATWASVDWFIVHRFKREGLRRLRK